MFQLHPLLYNTQSSDYTTPSSMCCTHTNIHTMACCALLSKSTEAGANQLIPNHSAELVTHAATRCANVAVTNRYTFGWFP